jgi:hypothetical protein
VIQEIHSLIIQIEIKEKTGMQDTVKTSTKEQESLLYKRKQVLYSGLLKFSGKKK